MKNEASSNEMKLSQAKASLEFIPAQCGFSNVDEFKRACNTTKKKLSEAETRQIQWKKKMKNRRQ